MKKVIFLICVLSFVLTGFNQQERIVEQSDTEIFESAAVGQKPVITKKLLNASVNEGGIGVFIASFEPIGDPKLQITWYYNDKPVELGDRIKAYEDKGDATLVIKEVMVEDAGIYTIKMHNDWGEVESKARLTVRAKS